MAYYTPVSAVAAERAPAAAVAAALGGADELDEQHEQREGEGDDEDRRKGRVLGGGGGRRRWRRVCRVCRRRWRCLLLCWPAPVPALGLGLGSARWRLRLLRLLGSRLRQPRLRWCCLACAMWAGLALAPAALAVRLGHFAPLGALRRRRVLLSERSRCPGDALRCERERVEREHSGAKAARRGGKAGPITNCYDKC